MSTTLQTMVWAYHQICAGEDPWTALGNFTNAWYDYAKENRAALIHEPLEEPAQNTEHLHHWAAFCAASVEFLCERYSVSCPKWVYEPKYTLLVPWYGDNIIDLTNTAILQYRIKTSPRPFAQRNIFCGNRLYQNKYEMSDLVQEARIKGMSDFHEIWHYASRKQMAIHGA